MTKTVEEVLREIAEHLYRMEEEAFSESRAPDAGMLERTIARHRAIGLMDAREYVVQKMEEVES